VIDYYAQNSAQNQNVSINKYAMLKRVNINRIILPYELYPKGTKI
jgi:hypothetical protein